MFIKTKTFANNPVIINIFQISCIKDFGASGFCKIKLHGEDITLHESVDSLMQKISDVMKDNMFSIELATILK